MPLVTVKNLHSKTIHCKSKTEKLLSILLEEVDWMHACGGKGRCTTCTAEIVSGEASLGEITEAEKRFINLGKLKSGARLACQAVVTGDVTVQVPESYKLPHQDYSK
ncbi:2Fe-2S iron-sulfur cluster-binding protein [Marinoscillum furvescens]|uniref:2Fe-2S ferredoxin n=1 Tax=Marinoscillum furvescens DSM 4134 TaxID=1122208 RepID=A0A3D9L9F6_MARFU|nr:2Fe-2S iron-sulfur cluster-binding protein [Marinoscillum furvescens]REE01692.1 2Fe-2S ferredoxin [Marinoscillum furvescens DSM 4134]